MYREIDTCLQRYSDKIFRDIPIMVRSHITHNAYTCVYFSLELHGDWKQGYNSDIIIIGADLI